MLIIVKFIMMIEIEYLISSSFIFICLRSFVFCLFLNGWIYPKAEIIIVEIAKENTERGDPETQAQETTLKIQYKVNTWGPFNLVKIHFHDNTLIFIPNVDKSNTILEKIHLFLSSQISQTSNTREDTIYV